MAVDLFASAHQGLDMSDQDQPIVVNPHSRSPWRGDEKVYVCTSWGALNGTGIPNISGGSERRALYQRAKLQGDQDAGASLVRAIISERVIDRLIDILEPFMRRRVPIKCVTPHPDFDSEPDPTTATIRPKVLNTLPLAYAQRLAFELDADVDDEIIQIARVGRTKLTEFPRFLYQPRFEGAVDRDCAYVLVDDVVTKGATLAALRHHIMEGGGTVAGFTGLAHGNGQWCELALSDGTWHELQGAFGSGLDGFWRREIGYDAKSLTEAEGRVLRKFAETNRGNGHPLIHCLRARLLEAAAKGQ